MAVIKAYLRRGLQPVDLGCSLNGLGCSLMVLDLDNVGLRSFSELKYATRRTASY